MAFSGLSSNKLFTNNTVGEDLSEVIRTLAPYEAPFLDWLGDPDTYALSTKHEYVEDFLRPRYIVASTAVNSLDTITAFRIQAHGEALTVGTLLENESAAPEVMLAWAVAAVPLFFVVYGCSFLAGRLRSSFRPVAGEAGPAECKGG